MLRTADLDFKYPEELVAFEAAPRGASRILKIPRDNENFEELTWTRFLAHFKEGDTLVLNDSQVLWARLIIKKPSGARGEIFFLSAKGKTWEILAKNLSLKDGKILDLPGGLQAKVIKADRISTVEIRGEVDLKKYFAEFGHVPLPPYIAKEDGVQDKERYQTVWAKHWGSVAAPTAGLHFTQKHLDDLKNSGVKIGYVTLHVGAGTFLPIQTDNLADFQIHAEVARVPQETCDMVLKSQAAGKKVWACGTTVLRSLETAVHASPSAGSRLPLIAPFLGETKLFVTPGYRFLVVDALLTNFHQPCSSLLALAAAFCVRNQATNDATQHAAVAKIIKAYDFAVNKKFRFFSYGDLTVLV